MAEVPEVDVERGVVAVADEDFGVGAEERGVEEGEELGGAPAAAGAEDAVDGGVGEGGMEVGDAVRGGAGVVERAVVEGVGHDDGVVAVGLERGAALLDALGFVRRGGGDDGDAASLFEGLGAWRWMNQAKSTSPVQMISAGPVRSISLELVGQTTCWVPPSAMAVSSRAVLCRTMAAVDAAQVPVPLEVVGPQPRS